MPAKVERCVKEVMKEQGVVEERAWAICQASINDGSMLNDKGLPLKAKIDDSTGFLTAPVNLARVGVQHYMGYELGLTDRLFDKIGVFRSPEEVFHPDSLDSFTNLTATDDHPEALVTVLNVKDLQVGTVSGVSSNTEKGVITGVVTITDVQTIKAIQNGKYEVSVGYSNDLKQANGVYNGIAYEYVQTNIRANHLAIVDAGRCGPDCKIITDHAKGEPMFKITIDGITFNTEDEQLAQAVGKLQTALDQSEEKKKEMEEEMDKEKAAKDAAIAAKDAAIADTLTDDQLNDLVHDRAVLIGKATTILGDKMPDCNCPKEIRKAVVADVYPNTNLDGKSDGYIEAMFDLAVDANQAKDKNLENLQKDAKDPKSPKAKETRDSARDKYMADTLKLDGGV